MTTLLTIGDATIATQEYQDSTRYGYYFGDKINFRTVATIDHLHPRTPDSRKRLVVVGGGYHHDDVPIVSAIISIAAAEVASNHV